MRSAAIALKVADMVAHGGWHLEDLYMWQPVGDHEIDIEFCIGDFCVGLYDADKNLVGEKYRAPDFFAAVEEAQKIIQRIPFYSSP